MRAVKQFGSLSTSYVNLAALLRHLREQNFTGLIHVVVDQYEAEIQLDGQEGTTASEIDPTTHEASQIPGAIERILVHAREPGGTITVYTASEVSETVSDTQMTTSVAQSDEAASFTVPASAAPPVVAVDWAELLDASGKLIGAIERALLTIGANFESSFHAARVQLGDDYPFLDPTGDIGLNYANREIVLSHQPSSNTLVVGLSECLRRVVNQTAVGKDGKRFRESVAIELAVAARLRPNGLGEFTPQLDRIAGTRVL